MKGETGKTGNDSYYMYKDRKITCVNYSLESAHETCKVCSNRTYCRESRRVIKVRIQIAEKYNEKVAWQNFINEVHSPREEGNSLFNHEQKKEPIVPYYKREENILKLDWDGYYARAHAPKRKGGGKGGGIRRNRTLSKKAMREIRYGDVPTIKFEI